jgi:hypothetical protein
MLNMFMLKRWEKKVYNDGELGCLYHLTETVYLWRGWLFIPFNRNCIMMGSLAVYTLQQKVYNDGELGCLYPTK